MDRSPLGSMRLSVVALVVLSFLNISPCIGRTLDGKYWQSACHRRFRLYKRLHFHPAGTNWLCSARTKLLCTRFPRSPRGEQRKTWRDFSYRRARLWVSTVEVLPTDVAQRATSCVTFDDALNPIAPPHNAAVARNCGRFRPFVACSKL